MPDPSNGGPKPDSGGGSPAPPPVPASTGEKRPRHFAVVEGAAVAFTLACVWLTAEAHIACWPVGIVGCLLYIYVFYHSRLYSDVLLQLYFLVTSIYGWYHWLHGGADDSALAVTRLRPAEIAAWAGVAVAGIGALGYVMKHTTRAALPYWDAFLAVLSFIAQYFLACKKVESWVLWITVDAVAIGVYRARRLPLTCLLYAVLLVLATKGLFEWLAMM